MNKTILYMAISADGFIAGPHDETPWSDESWKAFTAFVKSCDCLLLGKRTYEIMRSNDEFVNGPKYFVVTHNQQLDTGDMMKISIESKSDMPKCAKIGVIGGGELNGSLLRMGLIDEVVLDVENIKLGSGIELFGDHDIKPRLELLNTRRIGPNTVQKHYKILTDINSVRPII